MRALLVVAAAYSVASWSSTPASADQPLSSSASSNLAEAAGPTAGGKAPEQIHTAVAGAAHNGDATGLSIAWYTQQQTASSQVQFGRTADALSSTVRGSSASYLEDWGFHHVVELVGLTPSTEYYYRCGDGTTWSAVHRIVAPVRRTPFFRGLSLSLCG